MGCTIFVFPFSECLFHLQCCTKSKHLKWNTDYITLTLSRLNTAYVWLIWDIIGALMGFLLQMPSPSDQARESWGVGAMGVPYVSVYVQIHRRWKHNCKPLSLKHRRYTHSYPQARTYTQTYTQESRTHIRFTRDMYIPKCDMLVNRAWHFQYIMV